MATGLCWQMLYKFTYVWQIICQGMTDAMPLWQMLWPLSYVNRCVFSNLAEVMEDVADGMATVVRAVYFVFWGVKQNQYQYS